MFGFIKDIKTKIQLKKQKKLIETRIEKNRESIEKGFEKNEKNNETSKKENDFLNLNTFAFAFFISPFIFLGLVKLGELRTDMPRDWDLYLAGLAIIFIIPFTIGIILLLLKINTQNNISKLGITILTIVASAFYFILYLATFITNDSDLNKKTILSLILFAFFNSILLIYIFKSIFIRLKNWVFKIDDNKTIDIIKYRLSFINKLIIGFISIIASILAIILTLKKIIS
ncbi:hypothetical protein HMPREF2639_03175 [Staphylococcus sp. HMSC078D05]|nr:hypothetical protein HMPREF2639_03175 [Staphylococcus sp. HMSC078D05]